ncbi:MAG: response regulator [Lachnospiraceae bacterium]|nr:response regulator [Lachnospiraceae bacterium]
MDGNSFFSGKKLNRTYIIGSAAAAFVALVSLIIGLFLNINSIFFKIGCFLLAFAAVLSLALLTLIFLRKSETDEAESKKKDEIIETIQKESERRLHEANAKADFLVNMSHEIRTPMNAICCATELLMKEEHSETAGSYLGILKSSSDNLLDVVNDILDFSKIDAGRMSLTEAPYDVGALIEDVKNIVSVRLSNKAVAFTIDVDPTLPRVLIGDEVRIRQILINLLGNAAKFTGKGLISLNVTYERLSKETIDISFAIRDTGVGIAPSEKEKVFQKFGQAVSLKKGTEGTGLGLTICRELASMMGGSISFESELGKGSTFTARIRQRVTPDNVPIADVDKNRNLALDFLIWDDNIHYADNLERILTALGVSVKRVFRESEAEGVLSTVKTDFFIVSANMFKAVTEMIGRVSPTTIPVKLLDIGESDNGDFFGKYLVLRKPLDIFSVLSVIKNSGNRERFSLSGEAKFITPDARVLLVDDNRVNLKVARALFETFKAKVVDVDSGAEAVDLVAGGAKFDLIFMDHMMPGMDGIEAAKRIWETEGEKKTPIIALTANTGGEIEKMFFEAGMSDFLAKPIVMKHLSFVMQKWIPKDKIVYVQDDVRRNIRKRDRSDEAIFSPEQGIKAVWDDDKVFSSIVKVYVDASGEMMDNIGRMEPAAAKPIIEQLATMSRSAGAERLSDLLTELWNVSDMGTTDVYKGILRNVNDEYREVLTEAKKYLDTVEEIRGDEWLE